MRNPTETHVSLSLTLRQTMPEGHQKLPTSMIGKGMDCHVLLQPLMLHWLSLQRDLGVWIFQRAVASHDGRDHPRSEALDQVSDCHSDWQPRLFCSRAAPSAGSTTPPVPCRLGSVCGPVVLCCGIRTDRAPGVSGKTHQALTVVQSLSDRLRLVETRIPPRVCLASALPH